MHMGRTFLAKQGGKCVITPAQGLNEYVDGGCWRQKAQELPVVLSPSLCISAVPLRTDFSDLQHHSRGHGLNNTGRNSLKGSKGKAWSPSWKGCGAEGEIPVLAMPMRILPSAE